MAKRQEKIEGAQFVRYFGPLLDALRQLGGSGTPSEVAEQKTPLAVAYGVLEGVWKVIAPPFRPGMNARAKNSAG